MVFDMTSNINPANLKKRMYVVTITLSSIIFRRELYDYIRAEYRQIAIIVGSTTIGSVGILSV